MFVIAEIEALLFEEGHVVGDKLILMRLSYVTIAPILQYAICVVGYLVFVVPQLHMIMSCKPCSPRPLPPRKDHGVILSIIYTFHYVGGVVVHVH